MIDNIAASLSLPGTNPVAGTPASSNINQGAAPDTGNAADTPTSFASTLQSRLQQAAVNKPASAKTPSHDAAPNGKAATMDIDALLALNADKAAGPANPVALAALAAHENGENPSDAVHDAIAAMRAAKDKTKSDKTETSDTPTATPDTSTAPIVPTALNVIAATPAPSNPVPTPSDKQDPDNDSGPVAATADKDTTAILAATGDKNAAAPANPDKPKDGDFADLLKNNAQITGTNANAQPAHVANPNTTAPATREVRTPVSSPQWSNDVGNQVSWMVSQRESHADLVLNPPQLGRIEVSISLNGDQATANFVSPNADVRDALQGSLPRLREILADAGVFLGQANIGAESFQQNRNGAEKGTNSYGESISSPNETLLGSSGRSMPQGAMGVMRGQGLIDLFA